MFRVTTSHYFGQQDYYNNHRYSLEITYKPINTLLITLSPGYTSGFTELQYVTETSYYSDPRYIMASIDKEIFDLSFRANVSLTPELSIQYYAQPFIFAGKYYDYKRITSPRTTEFTDRFHTFGSNEISYNKEWNAYFIDENQDGNNDYGFYKPDFHYLQYRSNMVLRWEYKTGSSLYLVWSQGRTNIAENGEMQFDKYVNELWETHPRNDFMLKISYLLVF